MTPKPAIEVSPKAPAFNDDRMEAIMGRLLQVGVLLSSTTVFVGGVLYLRERASVPVSYRTFSGESGSLRHIAQLGHGIAYGDPAAIIQLGVLLLIATPIARVIFAAVAFAIERDRLYLAISLGVLTVLLVSLIKVN